MTTRCAWAGDDPAVHRLPRRGVGRAGPRRPAAVRVPDPRGRAGRAELVDDPAQARGLPPGVRRLRPAQVARLRRGAGRASCSPIPASSATASRSRRRSPTPAPSSQVQEEFGSFDAYLWGFVGGAPRAEPLAVAWPTLPRADAESAGDEPGPARRGFRFVGPTICYAFMQAVGMVNDHVVDCFRWAPLLRQGEEVS